mgnify:CR=1 FL=1
MNKKDFVIYGEVASGKLTIFRKKLLDQYLQTIKGRVSIAFRPRRAKRSLDQNAYYWAINTQIGWELGLNPEEVHAMFGDMFRKEHGEMTIKSTGERIELDYIRSTTMYNKVEFGEYLDNILQWAAEHSIIVLTSEEYYALEIFDNPYR